MKKASSKRSKTEAKGPSSSKRRSAQESASDEMRAHYDFDYGKSRPNRFASRLGEGTIAVVLDPDVATIFRSGEAVNSFLRSVISAMPTPEPAKKKRAS